MRIFIVTILFAIISSTQLTSQQTIEASIFHDGIQRSFIVYIPAIYDGSEAVPLLLNYHGYTSSALEQMEYGDFRTIADTAGFIIAHPQGTADFLGLNHWNSGGWTLFSTVDDVGFTEAMINGISTQLNIDQNRIYSTGMSNGGFMSYLLACQLSDRIAAIGSVTGSMSPQTFSQCDPQRPVPVIEIHGTADNVVSYTGGSINKSIRRVMRYWIEYNDCDPIPATENLPNLVPEDGTTALRANFSGGLNGTEVEHIRVFGGGHDWPGSSGNMDFNASAEVWRFLSRFDINGLRVAPALAKQITDQPVHRVFPNPFKDHLQIEGASGEPYAIMDYTGKVLMTGFLESERETLSISGLAPGLYIARIGSTSHTLIKE